MYLDTYSLDNRSTAAIALRNFCLVSTPISQPAKPCTAAVKSYRHYTHKVYPSPKPDSRTLPSQISLFLWKLSNLLILTRAAALISVCVGRRLNKAFFASRRLSRDFHEAKSLFHLERRTIKVFGKASHWNNTEGLELLDPQIPRYPLILVAGSMIVRKSSHVSWQFYVWPFRNLSQALANACFGAL